MYVRPLLNKQLANPKVTTSRSDVNWLQPIGVRQPTSEEFSPERHIRVARALYVGLLGCDMTQQR